MYRIEWSQTALIDLETILAYYTQEVSVKLAKKIFLRIQKQIDLLEHFPEGTRLWRIEGTREYVIHGLPYLVVLYVDGDKVVILNLMHTKRKYP